MKYTSKMTSAAAVLLMAACSIPTDPLDRRHGQLLVCHDEDETLTVSNADYHRHIEHGDSVGPCANEGG